MSGKKDGGFALPQSIKDRSGGVLSLGQYWDKEAGKWSVLSDVVLGGAIAMGADVVDWDMDGDVDLLIGSDDGRFFLRLNEGSQQVMAFSIRSEEVRVGDTTLVAAQGHVIPDVVDWNGDGLFDVLSGCADGGISWVRNVGKMGAPMFAKPEVLLYPKRNDGTFLEPTWPGERTQACATDFDDDGDLDLLVGDYSSAVNENDERPENHGWVWLFEADS
jgi:hypothetical protein